MAPAIAAQSRPSALLRIGQCLGDLVFGRQAEAVATLAEADDLVEALAPKLRRAQALESLAGLLAKDGRTGESRPHLREGGAGLRGDRGRRGERPLRRLGRPLIS